MTAEQIPIPEQVLVGFCNRMANMVVWDAERGRLVYPVDPHWPEEPACLLVDLYLEACKSLGRKPSEGK